VKRGVTQAQRLAGLHARTHHTKLNISKVPTGRCRAPIVCCAAAAAFPAKKQSASKLSQSSPKVHTPAKQQFTPTSQSCIKHRFTSHVKAFAVVEGYAAVISTVPEENRYTIAMKKTVTRLQCNSVTIVYVRSGGSGLFAGSFFGLASWGEGEGREGCEGVM